jgi:hypothetical protein
MGGTALGKISVDSRGSLRGVEEYDVYLRFWYSYSVVGFVRHLPFSQDFNKAITLKQDYCRIYL